MDIVRSSRPRQDAADRLIGLIELVLCEIREGRFQRTMAVLTAFAAVVSGFEAYIQHQRGSFSNWLMWTPVLLTLPVSATAGAAMFSERVARMVLPATSAVSLMDGLIGFIYHVRGILRLPGGLRLGQYNVVIGPPIFAPLLLCSVGILGLFASYLRPERFTWLEGRWRVGKRLLQQLTEELLPGLSTQYRPKGAFEELESDISKGRFQQSMALASAFLAALSVGEVYFEHLRGSFNQRWMWIPVWIAPSLVAAGAWTVRSEWVARVMLPFTSAATFVVGLLGFGLHLRGISRMPGSFANLRFNITLGPPLFAPLLFTAAGLLGAIAVVLQRRSRLW